MKKISLALIFVILIISAKAQLSVPIKANTAFTDSLNFIVKNYQNNFYTLQGETASTDAFVSAYVCRASVPGAKQSVIQRFQSIDDSTASWHAIMYSGENYKEAVRIYKHIFRLVSKSKIDFGANGRENFEGMLVEPNESLRFNSSILAANTENPLYENFVAIVDMQNTLEGWEVKLSLSRKRDDKEKY